MVTTSWTTVFRHHKAGLVTPIRISRGLPKFWPEAADLPACELLMPDPWMLGLKDRPKFERVYRAKLDRIGLDPILEALRKIEAEAPVPTLALVCFEARPRVGGEAVCHRAIVSDFWFEHTREPVLEWEPRSLGAQMSMQMEVQQ
jgi:hypothetical protein